jgi:hypothetical protein
LVRDEQLTVEFATLLSDDEDRVDAYHDDEPLCYRTLDNIFGDWSIPRPALHDFEAELHLTHEDSEPRSFAEAEGDAAWHATNAAGDGRGRAKLDVGAGGSSY